LPLADFSRLKPILAGLKLDVLGKLARSNDTGLSIILFFETKNERPH